MCTVLLPPVVNPIAVNKYININMKKGIRFYRILEYLGTKIIMYIDFKICRYLIHGN